MKQLKLTLLISAVLSILCQNASVAQLSTGHKTVTPGEIIYHVFQRSFFDSNNDLIGDINGLRQKLDYLQDLGITSILLLPVAESDFYHNYFATDYKKIDPEFGTMKDFIKLVEEVHRRGMKIYMDIETQYVTGEHIWYKDAMAGKNKDYILYSDSVKTKPESMMFNLTELASYDGSTHKITIANLYNKDVFNYNIQLLHYFTDPNGDGKFSDGVDGFRLDHMMDDLDFKGQLKNMFADYWAPLLSEIKKINPNIKIVAEQADWTSFGFEYFDKGHLDRVFAFRLQQAIASFDKNKIAAMADTTIGMTPSGKSQVVFIENHDMERFASSVNKNPAKEKIGAALNLLIGGIPSIYYGQELGMFGVGGFHKFNNSDANDIPRREAFEWYKSDTGWGMAIWYKNSGPWWDSTNLKPHDGISLEEEINDPNSLWRFYKKMIRLKKTNSCLANGNYQTLKNNSDSVYSFQRFEKNKSVIIAINLSGTGQKTQIDLLGSNIKLSGKLKLLWGNKQLEIATGKLNVTLTPFGIGIWQVEGE